MGVYGPLARSIEDLRLCFSLIAGPDGYQPEVPPVAAPGELEPVPVEQLRLAWTAEFGSATPGAETRAALAGVVSALEDAGCHVRQITPQINFDRLWLDWGKILAAEIGGPMPFLYRQGRRLQLLRLQDRSPGIVGTIRGMTLSRRDYVQALAYRDEMVRAFDDLLRPFDAWLCPVTRTPAFPHIKPGDNIEVDGQSGYYFLSTGAYTTPFNLSGQPVVVMPVGLSKGGLPVGIQVAGRRWQDEKLLDVASVLDEIMGNLQRPPGY